MRHLKDIVKDKAVMTALRSHLRPDGTWDVPVAGAVGVGNAHFAGELILPELPANAVIPRAFEGEMVFRHFGGDGPTPVGPAWSEPVFPAPVLREFCLTGAVYT